MGGETSKRWCKTGEDFLALDLLFRKGET